MALNRLTQKRTDLLAAVTSQGEPSRCNLCATILQTGSLSHPPGLRRGSTRPGAGPCARCHVFPLRVGWVQPARGRCLGRRDLVHPRSSPRAWTNVATCTQAAVRRPIQQRNAPPSGQIPHPSVALGAVWTRNASGSTQATACGNGIAWWSLLWRRDGHAGEHPLQQR